LPLLNCTKALSKIPGFNQDRCYAVTNQAFLEVVQYRSIYPVLSDGESFWVSAHPL
jgi:hypothetical protein